ncbi:putative phosphosugar-binding protein [Neobacillus niacini]|uniref:SIS domain-containing protein n=1 Tax=Neobacillus niacini TaxID=86668 RepID=UPI002783C2CE|nr:SIS domain-containing protein [Neobacillus niacini]MDQ1000454.1 putative phosphosugar-binding protein [Neobacillus niacini]
MLSQYFDKAKEKLDLVEQTQKKYLRLAAEKVAEAIQNGGIIQLFGCGHSHILTEEVFYRAGGLVPIKPILVEPLMLHEGALRSSQLERQNDLAEEFLKEQDFRPEDVVFVLSTSGRNPVPVDVAQAAQGKDTYVIGITSLEYSQSQPSRHKSGKHLYNSVDLVIDNHSTKGDAALSYEKVAVPFAPTSTVVGAVILNAIFAEAIKIMADKGLEPPIFLSGNIDGADDHNNSLVEKYRGRIPLLS